MIVTRQKFWGPVLLLISLAMPLPTRSVPKVTMHIGDLDEDTIVCEGCNPLIFGQPLNVNAASLEHLMTLPSIGEKRALAIVAHRQKHGKFSTLEDVKDVRGIGVKTLLKLQSYIVTE